MKRSDGNIKLSKGDALLIIDIQNDFLPGGNLAVPDGDQVISVLNGYIDQFINHQLPVFATRDWHPANHCSFIRQGGPWPEHCIAGSNGAKLASSLRLPISAYVISKGTSVGQGGYSGFENPALKAQLNDAGAKRLFIGGLATDYCVLNTVRDGLGLCYPVLLLTDAIRAMNVRPQDGENAINEMLQKGAIPITLVMIK